jgi:hypothetical protein
MTGKDEASADGILRPPRVAFSSFSTRSSIPCGVFRSMSFALKAGYLLVAGTSVRERRETERETERGRVRKRVRVRVRERERERRDRERERESKLRR